MLRRAGWLVPTALAQSPRLQAHLELTRCLILIPPWPSIYPDPLPLAHTLNPYKNQTGDEPQTQDMQATPNILPLGTYQLPTLIALAVRPLGASCWRFGALLRSPTRSIGRSCFPHRTASATGLTPLHPSRPFPLRFLVPSPHPFLSPSIHPYPPSSLAPPNSLLKSSPRRAFASVTGRLLPKPRPPLLALYSSLSCERQVGIAGSA